MKYIINLTVTFDPENRALVLENDMQQSIELSKPATRLLSELINNNRINLNRDDILKRVWEDYGFSPSNASLNNHISELRKAFTSLGMNKDIIFTVPRVGFRIDAEIHPIQSPAAVIKEEKPLTEEVATAEETGPFSDSDMKETKIKEQRQPKRRHWVIATAVAFALLLTASVAWMVFFVDPAQDDISFLITHEKCSIYDLNNNKPEKKYIDKVIKEMTDEGIDCTREDIDIYYAEARPNNEHLKVRLLSACRKINSIKYKNCINYKALE